MIMFWSGYSEVLFEGIDIAVLDGLESSISEQNKQIGFYEDEIKKEEQVKKELEGNLNAIQISNIALEEVKIKSGPLKLVSMPFV